MWEFLVDEKTGKRVKIHGKPVILWSAKSVLSMTSGFEHKQLCTGPTFNLGDACAYSCPFCYVEAATHGRFGAFLENEGLAFQDVVIRRKNALGILKNQLEKLSAKKRDFPHVAFSSTTVDIAANVELVKETADACKLIFEMTKWEIRLLSKSNMLPLLVSKIPKAYHQRLLLGVSTGTFDDELAQAVEIGTPLVTKRIESLYKLQDDGLRTYAMVCPSMPMKSAEEYEVFAQKSAELLRYDRMEHVWAEVMNVRGDNFTRTVGSLDAAGQIETRNLLIGVCGDGDDARDRWEEYARATFEAHKKVVPAGKLRFLQYVNRDTDLPYWTEQVPHGAVILGTAEKRAVKKELNAPVLKGDEEKIRALLEANGGLEGRAKLLFSEWFENGVLIGEHFARVKAEHPGRFISYLTTHFKVNRRTANNYMVLYEEQENIRERMVMGNVSHANEAYKAARKLKLEKKQLSELVDKTIEVEAEVVQPQPQLLLIEKNPTVEESEVVVMDSGETESIAPASDTKVADWGVFISFGPEELMADYRAVALKYEGKYRHQVIYENGQVKLNDYFAERLAVVPA